MFYVVIAFEHALLGLKWILNWLIQDVPARVQNKIEKKNAIKEKHMLQLLRESEVTKGGGKVTERKCSSARVTIIPEASAVLTKKNC